MPFPEQDVYLSLKYKTHECELFRLWHLLNLRPTWDSGTYRSWVPSGDGVLYLNSQVPILSITDGTTNTAIVGERPCSSDLSYGWGFSPYGNTGCGDGDTVLGSTDTTLASAMGSNMGFVAPVQPSATTGEADGAHFWSFHVTGANFLLCDGSVHFLSYSASSVFPQLCTRAGGEIFTLPY